MKIHRIKNTLTDTLKFFKTREIPLFKNLKAHLIYEELFGINRKIKTSLTNNTK